MVWSMVVDALVLIVATSVPLQEWFAFARPTEFKHDKNIINNSLA